MDTPPKPEASYPVTRRNKVKRLHDRARYDHASVHAILDAAALCHVAYVIEGQPYCTPTIHWREDARLYWHGSSASRMLRSQADGLPVCVTVSHLDGLVLARCGFNHSVNYRSAICFGTARIVDEPAEKAAALRAMIERFYPGRDEALRSSTAKELKATTVIGMEIEEASAKIRAKGNVDEPEDLSVPVWAGVIPITTVIGKPQPCPHNVTETHPGGTAAFTRGRRLDEVMTENQQRYERSA
jgi:nitroimidazol reductase NimA-like FMN-containing flavoprotein (pyridoxamine 5'-phosphate oxidase superfamily)